MAALYGYNITASLFIIAGSTLLLMSGRRKKAAIPPPVLIVALLLVFCLLSGFFYQDFRLKNIYLLVSSAFFISAYFLFSQKKINIKVLHYGIISLALLECMICISQYSGLLKSPNRYFEVTGSWLNPNVTAMFLAMALPLYFISIKVNRKSQRILSVFGCIVIVIVLIILQCRSALVGSFASFLVFYWKHLSLKLRNAAKNRTSLITILIVFLCVLAAVLVNLYKQKKDSADGRLLVWELSLKMIPERPIYGFGYGNFEKHYNRRQAEYFREAGTASIKKEANAAHVNMAYNEFLQNAVEGGMIGFTLFTALLLSLLLLSVPKKVLSEKLSLKEDYLREGASIEDKPGIYKASHAGIAAFASMSLMNFTVEAIPVMCLFLVYGSFLTANSDFTARNSLLSFLGYKKNHCLSTEVHKGKKILRPSLLIPILISFILGCCFLAADTLSKSFADAQNKKAKILAARGKKKQSMRILSKLAAPLREYPDYWENYGNVLFQEKRYEEALEKYLSGIKFSSEPELYMRAGYCIEKMGNKRKAARYYRFAKYMEPKKLTPRYAIMALYYNNHNYAMAAEEARTLLQVDVRIRSRKAMVYRKRAEKVIKRYQSVLKTDTIPKYSLPTTE